MTEIKIIIKSAGDKKHEVTVDVSKTIAEFKAQLATEVDIPAERQRLIYSGKVLKDADTVESYKIQDGHTIHLVKGAAPKSSTPAAAAASSTASGSTSTTSSSAGTTPSNIAAGQGSFNPLAGLTGARYAGYNVPMPSMEQLGFGADGMQLPSENQMEQMMESPMFQESMRAMLSDPQMLDYLIQQSPQLRAMGPGAREMLQSEYFRNMLTNPQMMRQMMQLQRAMGGMGGMGGFGSDAASAFPAPGNPNATTASTTAPASNTTTSNTDSSSTTIPATGATGAAAAGSGAAAANPFAALLGGAGAGAGLGGLGGAGGAAGANPFLNPALMQFLGGAGAGTGLPTAQPPHHDNRPPEEVYETQLRQLNDMGFFDFDRNVAALRRSGGSVEGAIEALLNGSV
ncbi:unnamed protein product [Ambrosiozyma monospora]|uniref:Unnamed protein product n=1 Tax=Ambrosiozyma monospora TaxID=43982 RepID=A0ACB5SU98_AMBMO|nr:unnamed protein product [Ambrosiozyma monospora]